MNFKEKFLSDSFHQEIIKKYSLNIKFVSNEFEDVHKSREDNYFNLTFELSNNGLAKYLKGISLDDLVHNGDCLVSGHQKFWKIINTRQIIEFQKIDTQLRLLYKKDFKNDMPPRVIELIEMMTGDYEFNYERGQLCSATIPSNNIKPLELNVEHPFNSILDDYFNEIQSESKQVLKGQIKTSPYKLYGEKWSRLALYRNGELNNDLIHTMPKTLEFVKKCESFGRLISFDLLLMEPGKELYYHSDGFAFFDNWQCGVIVPKDCVLEVMGNKVEHEPKKTFLFNDSFNHKAWNSSDSPRIILSAWIVHREWNDEEVDALKFLARTFKWGS